MSPILKEKIRKAYEEDKEILVERSKISETLGSDAKYLSEILGLNKSDLIRLERLGLAVKARYEVKATKEHRIRWVIFSEVLNAN